MTTTPLRAVLEALQGGAHSRAELAGRTGLRPDTVDAALEHLVRMGRLEVGELSTGCPSGGCGSCPSGVDDGPGCGSSAPVDRPAGAPVLLQLTLRRPA
jgi:FeoC-like transcriptional regulator